MINYSNNQISKENENKKLLKMNFHACEIQPQIEYVFWGGKEGHIILSTVYNKTVVYKLQNDKFSFFYTFNLRVMSIFFMSVAVKHPVESFCQSFVKDFFS